LKTQRIWLLVITLLFKTKHWMTVWTNKEMEEEYSMLVIYHMIVLFTLIWTMLFKITLPWIQEAEFNGKIKNPYLITLIPSSTIKQLFMLTILDVLHKRLSRLLKPNTLISLNRELRHHRKETWMLVHQLLLRINRVEEKFLSCTLLSLISIITS
jgi:hypothetical protein